MAREIFNYTATDIILKTQLSSVLQEIDTGTLVLLKWQKIIWLEKYTRIFL